MARIGEPGGERSVDQLEQRVAEIEARLAVAQEAARTPVYSDEALATVASRVYRARRRRERLFDATIFADPAWDMLLDLFLARARGQELRTTSLCHASGVPPTTALRWVDVLAKQGLIERRAAPDDRRVKIVTLSDQGYRVMRGGRSRTSIWTR